MDNATPDADRPEALLPPKRVAAWRGLRMTCPNCEEAGLFRAYLKQVESCPSCGAEWGEIRADDGPAWATMLVVGHVLAAVFHIFIFRLGLSTWGAIAGLCAIAVVMSLWLLPRMKGLFIGFIWASGALTS